MDLILELIISRTEKIISLIDSFKNFQWFEVCHNSSAQFTGKQNTQLLLIMLSQVLVIHIFVYEYYQPLPRFVINRHVSVLP